MAAEIFGSQFTLMLGKYRLRISCALECGASDEGDRDAAPRGPDGATALRVPRTWSLS